MIVRGDALRVVVKELEHVNFSQHTKTRSGTEFSKSVRTANGRAANNVSRESANVGQGALL